MLMHENEADIRFIQEILGNVKLEMAQIYTHVSVWMPQKIHAPTHPAALFGYTEEPSRANQDPAAEGMFSALAAEAENDKE
jgi:hypothetical protein